MENEEPEVKNPENAKLKTTQLKSTWKMYETEEEKETNYATKMFPRNKKSSFNVLGQNSELFEN